MLTYLKASALTLLALILPVQSLCLAVGFLVLVDLITGLMAAKKQSIPITSAGFRRTVVKMFLYESSIIAAFVVSKYVLDAGDFVQRVLAGAISVTEFKSILENTNIVTGHDLIKAIKDALMSDNSK